MAARACSGESGAGEKPHTPMTSVVTPWDKELIADGLFGNVKSAWEWKSKKPGATTRPGRVDHPGAAFTDAPANVLDQSSGDGDVGPPCRGTGSVNHRSTLDHEVGHRAVSRAWWIRSRITRGMNP